MKRQGGCSRQDSLNSFQDEASNLLGKSIQRCSNMWGGIHKNIFHGHGWSSLKEDLFTL